MWKKKRHELTEHQIRIHLLAVTDMEKDERDVQLNLPEASLSKTMTAVAGKRVGHRMINDDSLLPSVVDIHCANGQCFLSYAEKILLRSFCYQHMLSGIVENMII